MLGAGASPVATDEAGWTACERAVVNRRACNLEVVRTLLSDPAVHLPPYKPSRPPPSLHPPCVTVGAASGVVPCKLRGRGCGRGAWVTEAGPKQSSRIPASQNTSTEKRLIGFGGFAPSHKDTRSFRRCIVWIVGRTSVWISLEEKLIDGAGRIVSRIHADVSALPLHELFSR